MSITHHGYHLQTPVLLPNTTRFTTTLIGFDTGEREFEIDSAYFDQKKPRIGDCDADLIWRGPDGLTSGTKTQMYVTGLEETYQDLEITRYRVSFMGLLDGNKPPNHNGGCSAGQYRSTTPSTFRVPNARYTAFEFNPQIVSIYVQDGKPDLAAVGSKSDPAGFFGGPIVAGRTYVEDQTGNPSTYIFIGWILKNRQFRQAGPLFEITDTHSYERIRSES